MVEVPQEDFKIENFKSLQEVLKNKLVQPDPIYEK